STLFPYTTLFRSTAAETPRSPQAAFRDRGFAVRAFHHETHRKDRPPCLDRSSLAPSCPAVASISPPGGIRTAPPTARPISSSTAALPKRPNAACSTPIS